MENDNVTLNLELFSHRLITMSLFAAELNLCSTWFHSVHTLLVCNAALLSAGGCIGKKCRICTKFLFQKSVSKDERT